MIVCAHGGLNYYDYSFNYNNNPSVVKYVKVFTTSILFKK